jgi:hypothetical protein
LGKLWKALDDNVWYFPTSPNDPKRQSSFIKITKNLFSFKLTWVIAEIESWATFDNKIQRKGRKLKLRMFLNFSPWISLCLSASIHFLSPSPSQATVNEKAPIPPLQNNFVWRKITQWFFGCKYVEALGEMIGCGICLEHIYIHLCT